MNEHDTVISLGTEIDDNHVQDSYPSEVGSETALETDEKNDRESESSVVEESVFSGASPEATAVEEALPLAVSTDSDTTSLDPLADTATDDTPNVKELQEEIARLRTLLANATTDVIRREIATGEFCELFPDVKFEDLTDDVFTDVQRGIPLCAAYALAERRRIRKEEHAALVNAQNRTRSSGSLGNAETDLFSPDEVRAMSQAEVRANYDKILRSMQTWH